MGMCNTKVNFLILLKMSQTKLNYFNAAEQSVAEQKKIDKAKHKLLFNKLENFENSTSIEVKELENYIIRESVAILPVYYYATFFDVETKKYIIARDKRININITKILDAFFQDILTKIINPLWESTSTIKITEPDITVDDKDKKEDIDIGDVVYLHRFLGMSTKQFCFDSNRTSMNGFLRHIVVAYKTFRRNEKQKFIGQYKPIYPTKDKQMQKTMNIRVFRALEQIVRRIPLKNSPSLEQTILNNF